MSDVSTLSEVNAFAFYALFHLVLPGSLLFITTNSHPKIIAFEPYLLYVKNTPTLKNALFSALWQKRGLPPVSQERFQSSGDPNDLTRVRRRTS